jgi:hypothetical protein
MVFLSLKTETACFYKTLVLTRADGVTTYDEGKVVRVLENATGTGTAVSAANREQLTM